MNSQDQELLEKLQEQERNCVSAAAIRKIEEQYKAAFVGCFALKSKNGWTENLGRVFYNASFDHCKNQSEYFALFHSFGSWYICSADWIKTQEYSALVQGNNIGFSRSVHDYVPVGDAAIDGGLEYLHLINFSSSCRILKFKVQQGRFTAV